MPKQSVTLNPGEARAVTFEFTPTVAKSYQVAVDGQQGNFIAIEQPVAYAQFSLPRNITILDKDRVPAGSSMYINVLIFNNGDAGGYYTIKWFLDGALFHSSQRYLGAGGYKVEYCPLTAPTTPGTYHLECIGTAPGPEYWTRRVSSSDFTVV